MINLTKDILIVQSGDDLARSIKAAISKARIAIYSAHAEHLADKLLRAMPVEKLLPNFKRARLEIDLEHDFDPGLAKSILKVCQTDKGLIVASPNGRSCPLNRSNAEMNANGKSRTPMKSEVWTSGLVT